MIRREKRSNARVRARSSHRFNWNKVGTQRRNYSAIFMIIIMMRVGKRMRSCRWQDEDRYEARKRKRDGQKEGETERKKERERERERETERGRDRKTDRKRKRQRERKRERQRVGRRKMLGC